MKKQLDSRQIVERTKSTGQSDKAGKSAVKTVSYVMLITLLGKFMALVRESLLARAYGTSMEADAFLAASFLPRVLFDAVFASAITMSFIPIFSECMAKGGKKKAFAFSDTFISFVGALMVILSILGMVFSKAIATFSVDRFDPAGIQLTADLLKILFPTLLFTGITFSFIGILQSLDSFVIPALTGVVFNAVIILYFFGPDARWRIYGLAVIYLVGWILQAAIQLPELRKKEYRFRFNFDLKNGYMQQVGMTLLPVMISTWVQPLNIGVNQKFASAVDGGVSAMHFANNIYTMIVGVFVLSIMNVFFPKMSALNSQGEKKEAEKLTGQILGFALFLVFPMMAGLLSVSSEIINLIYTGREFDGASAEITSQALFYFTLGMVGYALQTILARVYFAERKGKVPMIGAMIAIITNVVLSFVLMGKMQIGGLALSSSISGTVYGIVLMIPLLKKERNVFDKTFFVESVKAIIASLVMAGGIALVRPYVAFLSENGKIGQVLFLGTMVGIGIVLYMLSAVVLKAKEINNIRAFIRRKRG